MKQILKPYTTSYSLARRMMLIVILWSVIFTFIITAAQGFLDYSREMEQLNDRLRQIRLIEEPSLINSVWHFDDNQIKTQLQGMLNLQDIKYIELQIIGGKTYTAGLEIPKADAIIQTNVLEYTQDGETYSIGQLVVMADIRSLQQRVLSWLFRNLLFSAIQIFLLAGFILLIVDWLLTRPLNDIVHYADNLDLNHLEQPLVLQHRKLASQHDELETLAQKLNEMRLRLAEDITERKQMENALRDSERNYREIFNATSEAIFIHDAASGRILQVNTSMLHMYGYSNEAEVQSITVGDLSTNIPPYAQKEAGDYLQKALTEGPQVFEWLARKKSGETFWAEVSLRSSLINGEERVLAVVRDITERKRAETLLLEQNEALIAQGHALKQAEAETRQLNAELEIRVNERTEQLTALNQELEAFSYSVAHDLRGPLRSMNGFSQVILEDYGDQLNGEVKDLLQHIHHSAKNLTKTVDALLSLSHLTRDDAHLTNVDLSSLAQTIANNLCLSELQRKAEFVIAPDLNVHVDKNLIEIMFENLLGNAWKFTANNQITRIEVGCLPPSEAQKSKVYFVRDNGAGFDMAYANRLFSPFQRLHTTAEFSGTGIGLATVKRIVQRHGGHVWAESTLGLGATFYFTLS